MDFNKVLNHRRSVRSFTNEQLTDSQILELKNSVLKVPSAKSIYPWKLYFITNKEKIEILSRFKSSSGFIKQAPLHVVVTADTSLSDMWIEDCSIVATYLLLKAVDLGLGACWLQVRNRQHNDKISARQYILNHLDLSETFGIECIIAIGHPESEPVPHYEQHTNNKYKIVDIT
ncbi:MAG TPA: nitroreductase family protein [Salinivirgaceae bacterium]|nr:nitroreductase family protein [Salinivirgaceae bacterium]